MHSCIEKLQKSHLKYKFYLFTELVQSVLGNIGLGTLVAILWTNCKLEAFWAVAPCKIECKGNYHSWHSSMENKLCLFLLSSSGGSLTSKEGRLW